MCVCCEKKVLKEIHAGVSLESRVGFINATAQTPLHTTFEVSSGNGLTW